MLNKLIRNTAIILVFLTFVGGLLRVYKIGEVPVGFHADEAYFGYNAYSLLRTGKDITGHFLPIHLESFLYSPGGYSYLIIPFLVFFDLSPVAVRLPAAIIGTATIILTFFLVRKIFSQEKHSVLVALITTFLVTISPWHINLSRASAENVIVVFLIILSVFLYLKWVENQRFLLLLFSIIFFASTYLFYQAPRAFLPLFIPFLVLFFSRKLKLKEYFLIGILYLFFIVLPLIIIVTSDTLSYRLRMLSVFSYPKTQALINEAIVEDGLSSQPVIVTRVFHNKIIGYTSEIFDNYMQHLSYSFLFKDEGLPTRYRVPNMGLLYLFELPLIVVGLYSIVRLRSRGGLLCIVWILLGFVGSALTYDDVPNLQRTLLVLPALQVVGGVGAVTLFKSLPSKVIPIVVLGSVIIVLYFVAYYLHQYFIHQIIHKPIYRQEGYKELVKVVNKLLPQYQYAAITTRQASPLIFFLFYSKYDPAKFQQEIKKEKHNFLLEDFGKVSINKYKFFTDACFDKDNLKESILYVDLGSCDVPYSQLNVLKEIKRVDESVVFRVYDKKIR
jgi:4-amino-4-deoxy-L-arabinose transferase-like glycosyltransferase